MTGSRVTRDLQVMTLHRRPIIMLTHDESTFSTNNSRRKIWILKGHNIICPKEKGKDIMVSDFLLSWLRLNLLSRITTRTSQFWHTP